MSRLSRYTYRNSGRLKCFNMDGFMTARITIVILLIFSETAWGSYVRRASRPCTNGHFGPTCQNLCGGHCSKNQCYLLPNGRSVKCTEGCVKGWRGTMCSGTCRIGCRQCARYSGECIGHCRDGYYGPDCSTRCPGNCRKCHRVSGHCDGDCPIGYYGIFCTNKCSCNKCLKKTGKCLLVEPLSMAVSLTTVTAEYNHQNIESVKRGHRGDVGLNKNQYNSITKEKNDDNHGGVRSSTYRSSMEKLYDGVRSKAQKHRSPITKLYDDDDDGDDDDNDYHNHSKEVLQIPPQIVVVIVIMSVAALVMLVAVPFIVMGKFTGCAKRRPSPLQGQAPEIEEPSFRQKMHIYEEINDTLVKDVLMNQAFDRSEQKIETEDSEAYTKRFRSREEEEENDLLYFRPPAHIHNIHKQAS